MPVAARSHELRDKVLGAVDQRFAEPVRISFLNKEKTEADPERPAVEIEGVLRTGGGKETGASGARADNWRTRLAAGKAELHIAAASYDGPRIATGDRVVALSRKGEPWWEVLRVDDRGENRLVLELGEI